MGSKERPNNYWNCIRIDKVFFELKESLGRVPFLDDFTDAGYRGAANAIRRGRYHPAVKNYSQYLKFHNQELNHDMEKWNKNSIFEAYTNLKYKLKRRPTNDDFKKEGLGSVIGAIRAGKYDPLVITFGQFLKTVGEESRQPLTRERIIFAYSALKKKLGRIPTTQDFKDNNLSSVPHGIRNGKYHLDIKSWNQFLISVEGECHHQIGKWT